MLTRILFFIFWNISLVMFFHLVMHFSKSMSLLYIVTFAVFCNSVWLYPLRLSLFCSNKLCFCAYDVSFWSLAVTNCIYGCYLLVCVLLLILDFFTWFYVSLALQSRRFCYWLSPALSPLYHYGTPPHLSPFSPIWYRCHLRYPYCILWYPDLFYEAFMILCRSALRSEEAYIWGSELSFALHLCI